MTADLDVPARKRTAGPVQWLAGWKLWTVPPSALALVLTVELLAVAGFALVLRDFDWTTGAALRWLLLVGMSVLHAELSARVERLRRYLTAGVHVTMTSVWAFTAVLSLPASYAAALVIVLFVHSNWQRRQQRSTVAHRELYSISVAVLGSLAACEAHRLVLAWLPPLVGGLDGALAALAALIVYLGVNSVLVLTTIYLVVRPVPLRDLLPEREELALEVGTLVLGIFTAQALIATPWLVPLVIVLLVLLQRSSLVAQLEVAAATDTKTGLLNASAWQELAQRELVRSQHTGSPCALMLLDLDHFKRVNDTLGHLAGDVALRAIGDALKRELRGYDAVARFGGEEFVVLLNDLNLDAAVLVAERTLSRIRGLEIAGSADGASGLRLTASIGLAAHPQHGQHLTDLLEAADLALYAAKSAGRDQVGLPAAARQVARPA